MTAPPHIFDRNIYRCHRARAARHGGDGDFLLQDAIEALTERLAAVNRRFTHGLELGARPATAAAFAPFAQTWTRLAVAAAEGGDAVGDDDLLPFAEGQFDLVVSVLSLQTVNDLPGALAQIRRLLRPDGLFMAALFGGDTLFELRDSLAAAEIAVRGGLSPRVSPFAEVRSLGALLQRAGFALPVADSERTTVNYSNINRLFADLRAMGETNCLHERTRQPAGKTLFAALTADYAARHATATGKLTASFEIVYLTGWAPHESQQKPLRPGSATARLADALAAVRPEP